MIINDTINITDVITHIIYEVIKFCPTFHHIDINRILVCVSTNRSRSRGGATFGKLIPLRFKGGTRYLSHNGKKYTMPGIVHNGHDMLYIIYFYMPRFFDLQPHDKLEVIFHELYHINEEFNGDIRRMAAKKAAHGHSRKAFNSLFREDMEKFCNYIAGTPYMNFLQLDAKSMHSVFRRVTARRMKVPRPVPAGV